MAEKLTWEEIIAADEIDEQAIAKLGKVDLLKLASKLAENNATTENQYKQDFDNQKRDYENQKQKLERDHQKNFDSATHLLETHVTTLEKEVTKLEMDNDTLEIKVNTLEGHNLDLDDILKQKQIDKDRLLVELEETQTLLEEKSKAHSEMLDKLDSGNVVQTDSTRAKCLLITSESLRILEKYLPCDIDWEVNVIQSVKELKDMIKDNQTKQFSSYDKVVIFLGTDDIKNRLPKDITLRILHSSLAVLAKIMQVAVMQIPPCDVSGFISEVDLFNLKIKNLKVENTQVIPLGLEIERKSKKRITNGFALSEEGAQLLGEQLKRTMTIPDINVKPRPHHEESVHYADEFTHFVEIDKERVGRIIGKGGETIQSITRDYHVSISLGRWVTGKKGDEKSVRGAHIRGKIDNIVKTNKRIAELVGDIEERELKKNRRE